MPAEIINRMHAMADKQEAPPGLVYLRHNGDEIREDDVDEIPQEPAEEH